MDPWTDLDSVLADPDGCAALYGYLESMDKGDTNPRRLHRYIQLLEEVRLYREQADGAARTAQHILNTYVNADRPLDGLATVAPSQTVVGQLSDQRAIFDRAEETVRGVLSPLIPSFLQDVKRGEKKISQRVKESGYRAFIQTLRGKEAGKRCTMDCTLS